MARREKAVHSAEYWEKRARRKKLARQKQLRRRMLIAAAVCLVLAVVIGVLVRIGGAHEEPAVSTTREPLVVTPAETGSAAAGTDAAASENAAGSESVPEAQPKEPAPEAIDTSADPRVSFAVDPSFTDWNYSGDGTKTIYLTFDDGPSPITPEVLNILDTYGVKATFFVTAQLPQYVSYIREAYLRGHTIGLHSYTHDYSIYRSEEAYMEDLVKIGDVVKTQIGYVPCFIRFPGGASNETSKEYSEGIMTALTAKVQELGYQYYDWNVAVGDGAEAVTADQEVEHALATEADTVILLAHDGESKSVTVEALPKIIEGYLERGYTFKAIDRSSTVIHHPVLN